MVADDGLACAECGRTALVDGARISVQFENAPHEVWKDFCSWDHVAAWVGRGEPEWEAEAIQPRPQTWWGKVGCLAVLILLGVVFVTGLVSLVRLAV